MIIAETDIGAESVGAKLDSLCGLILELTEQRPDDRALLSLLNLAEYIKAELEAAVAAKRW